MIFGVKKMFSWCSDERFFFPWRKIFSFSSQQEFFSYTAREKCVMLHSFPFFSLGFWVAINDSKSVKVSEIQSKITNSN